jgi:5'-3' exonuclease
VKEVAPSKGVYIAIDGVVPMAKMRQQRLRRFKSVWEKVHSMSARSEMALPSEKENASRIAKPSEKESVAKWDTNAITPGTVFMKNLATALQAMCDEKGWILSSSESPGEGEHKLLAQWRTGVYKGADIAVYGMDADLIVLSLLGQYQNQLGNIWLFREAPPIDGIIGFEWFSIDSLKGWILQGRPESFILTYCFAMSILGNDFLPSSLGLKMRDGGHDELLRCLTMPLIDDSYQIMEENVDELFRVLSLSEHHRITRYIQGKQRMAYNAVETGFGENNWPLTQIETSLLNADWVSEYWRLVGGDPLDVCTEYIKGIKWIWAYYTGSPVCFNWFYPYLLPPLWAMVCTQMHLLQNPLHIKITAEDIRSVEQLALVLPLQSWSLIPDCPEKRFPMVAPQFFPSSFEFEAVGKRFFWECEALIPIPTIIELKSLIATI